MSKVQFPKVVKLRQTFPDRRIADPDDTIRNEIAHCIRQRPLRPGAKIAITAGSRGIRNIPEIMKSVVSALREGGYSPFLVSAMGSHGGGSKAGQTQILESLGVTGDVVGAPVVASDETVCIGETSKRGIDPAYADCCMIEGLQVHIAREALEADAVLVVNRIKPHTSFHGDYESGLMKMMAVGLGRAPGADSVHRLGANRIAQAIPSIASYMLSHAPIWAGLAIVENAYDEPHLIKGIPAPSIPRAEPELLNIAKSLMPAIPFRQIDLCIVCEMGKNYSGTGVDTNVIGRLRIAGVPEPDSPEIRYLGILGLSEASHGNATGIGLADFTTRRVMDGIDWHATYLNCLTSGFTARAAAPIVARHDRDLIGKAMFALKADRPEQVRLLILKNTLHLDELWASEAMVHEVRGKDGIEVIGGPQALEFDSGGYLRLA